MGKSEIRNPKSEGNPKAENRSTRTASVASWHAKAWTPNAVGCPRFSVPGKTQDFGIRTLVFISMRVLVRGDWKIVARSVGAACVRA